MAKKYLYVRTTKDKYEYPIAVADNPRELAQMLGVSVETVYSEISRKKKHWYKIPLEDE